jgi:hypothetical protein
MLNDFGIPAFVRDVPDALYCQKEPLFIGGKLYFARIPVVRLALNTNGSVRQTDVLPLVQVFPECTRL